MSYQPVLPLGGYAGWRFLTRTLETQQAAFSKSKPVQRAADHFRANIAKANTAEALVKDRRLLEVALGAFGLKDDLGAKAFIQRILEGGTVNRGALANKLADPRYKALAREFDYGDLNVNRGVPGFADKIVAMYEAQSFQVAVGNANDDMRLALNVEGAIKQIAAATANERSQWFSVMGNKPLRAVFERALGFPPTFAAIDIDQQLAAFQERAEAVFGTSKPSDFADPGLREKLVRLFMVRSEAQASSMGSASMALQLLQRR